jgi:hypothetical protein
MNAFAAIFLLEAAAAVLTAGGCWLAAKSHHRPGWYLAFLGAIAPAAAVYLFPDGGFLFHPERFQHSKTSPTIELQGFLQLAAVAIIPTLLVVRLFRQRFRADLKSAA